MTLHPPNSRLIAVPLWRLIAGVVILSLVGSGCRQRAYNELYVENMASEIRLLEDRVYEYDAEYRALENELEDLKQINDQLESRLREVEQERADRFKAPKSSPSDSRSEPTPSKSRPMKPSAPKESLKLPPNDIELDVETPAPPPIKKPAPSSSGELLPPPPTDLPSGAIPELPSSKTPDPLPPSSNPQIPDRASNAPRGLPSVVARASYEERRIPAPNLPPTPSASSMTTQGSTNTESANPSDQQVREIAFHPGLCRGVRRDGKTDEDGIALVLVPRNIRQEFVPVGGKLTVILEETVGDQANRLGKWEFTPQETKEHLEPVGSGQGIHLELPWQDVAPQTNVIDVYVRFTDDRGITMVNHRQVHLRKPTPGQSTWTPK